MGQQRGLEILAKLLKLSSLFDCLEPVTLCCKALLGEMCICTWQGEDMGFPVRERCLLAGPL